MSWSYKRLWIQLVESGMKKTDLLKVAGISSSALAKMGKSETITMNTLGKLCEALHCGVEDIVEYIPDEET